MHHSPPFRVRLTLYEQQHAAMIGVQRRTNALADGGEDRNGAAGESEQQKWWFNIVGAMGELAFCRHTNLYWPADVHRQPKNTPDVEPYFQIRTLRCHHYDLLIRPDDCDDHYFVLLTGEGPEFVIRGGIWARAAKQQDQLFRDRGDRGKPAWWIPQNQLTWPDWLPATHEGAIETIRRRHEKRAAGQEELRRTA